MEKTLSDKVPAESGRGTGVGTAGSWRSVAGTDGGPSGGGGKAAKRRLIAAVAVAAVLWFFMFSPWTGHLVNFWVMMSFSAVALISLALWGGGFKRPEMPFGKLLLQVAAGVAIAFALWGIFWVGDKLSQLMFDFARPQVDDVYGMKEGTPPVLISLLLLFVIGPAEEYFWRGYVQKKISDLHGCNVALFATAAVYALVHIWSFNFMLVMAALVAGAVWGVLYRIRPSLLPALIVSHALWDALVFIILPI